MERLKGYEGILIIFLLQIGLSHSSCGRAEYETGGQCCPMCAAGNRVNKDCTEFTSTSCIPCIHGTYLDEPNGLKTCFLCSQCDSGLGLRVNRACTPTSDTVCEPLEGYHCTDRVEKGCIEATKHSKCKPGQYISQRGTEFADTVCMDCVSETYSDGTFTQCKSHRKCNSTEQTLNPGTSASDTVCGKQNQSQTGFIVGSIILLLLLSTIGIITFYCCSKERNNKNSVIGRINSRFKSNKPIQETNVPPGEENEKDNTTELL